MPASKTARASDNRFQSLSPASLSRTENSSVVKLALAVLSARYRPGRAMTSPEDMQALMRLKLNGRRNEVFGVNMPISAYSRRGLPPGPGHSPLPVPGIAVSPLAAVPAGRGWLAPLSRAGRRRDRRRPAPSRHAPHLARSRPPGQGPCLASAQGAWTHPRTGCSVRRFELRLYAARGRGHRDSALPCGGRARHARRRGALRGQPWRVRSTQQRHSPHHRAGSRRSGRARVPSPATALHAARHCYGRAASRRERFQRRPENVRTRLAWQTSRTAGDQAPRHQSVRLRCGRKNHGPCLKNSSSSVMAQPVTRARAANPSGQAPSGPPLRCGPLRGWLPCARATI